MWTLTQLQSLAYTSQLLSTTQQKWALLVEFSIHFVCHLIKFLLLYLIIGFLLYRFIGKQRDLTLNPLPTMLNMMLQKKSITLKLKIAQYTYSIIEKAQKTTSTKSFRSRCGLPSPVACA